ncbi:outer membrane beta-barrel protein [Cellulophaga sp. HaHaR_3_176]|uniref:outer membrane beta-barrel protein n=1 Tax=Cellulophaga sp. HaHaR_3_176 TaxID=1942464 RepID=UPI001C1FA4C3|nr:outer membrane beta-barrel protein [Cellulophaga sp. HaHaR_3_176]QWX84685.1 outer membrane beta-barrel protein [Cellulophaga sp. HaHaR_3_176]
MKKLFLVAAFALIGFSVQAQEGFKLGVTVQLPVGDASDFSSFGLGLDAAYMFEVSDQFDLGIATGFNNIFGKTFEEQGFEFEVEDAQYIPLAAAARFKATEDFSVGADLGYAIGINEGNDGGFYYKPTVGYMVSEATQLNLSYVGISADGGTFSTINLGVLFSL